MTDLMPLKKEAQLENMQSPSTLKTLQFGFNNGDEQLLTIFFFLQYPHYGCN